MRRETTLVVLAAIVVVVVGGVLAAVPDGIDDPRVGNDPAGDLSVVGQAVEPVSVSGSSVDLRVVTDISHRGGPVENVTVRYRAVDASGGILTDQRRVEVGTIDVAGEQSVEGQVQLPREGGYDVITTVFVGDERVADASTSVQGVAALEPAYVDRSLQFADTSVWPTLSVSVIDTTDDQATLQITASITNTGDTAAAGVELGVLLRQADSNVVAGEATAEVDTIRPARTNTVSTSVTVPAGYNYYVDSILQNDGIIVDEAGDVANLNPQETIQANQTVEDVQFQVADFENGATEIAQETESARDEPVSDGTPGFGAIAAAVALVVITLVARIRR
ncbi:MAG: uncharacterized protein conserved in archaea [uncultured archaeon A07HR60]|nr:MAG: uncharacterized protein conserved in archaea [uncultured archaeon A07HR60]